MGAAVELFVGVCGGVAAGSGHSARSCVVCEIKDESTVVLIIQLLVMALARRTTDVGCRKASRIYEAR